MCMGYTMAYKALHDLTCPLAPCHDPPYSSLPPALLHLHWPPCFLRHPAYQPALEFCNGRHVSCPKWGSLLPLLQPFAQIFPSH